MINEGFTLNDKTSHKVTNKAKEYPSQQQQNQKHFETHWPLLLRNKLHQIKKHSKHYKGTGADFKTLFTCKIM